MMLHRLGLLVFLLSSIHASEAFARQEEARDYRTELKARLGLGNILILGSNEVDTGANIGGGIEVRAHPRLGIEFDATRMFNLAPTTVPCGLDVPCTGAAVEGVRSASHFSGNVLYYFRPSARVEPYVLGGAGALRSRSAKSITFRNLTSGRIVQQPDEVENALSLGFGGGIRAHIARRLSVRLEVRLYDSSLQSRQNLSLMQAALMLGYSF